jgi:membrane protein YqaA with SNARE-associated domain
VRGRQRNWLAVLWGFAEATVFFIVPDVLLSWFALENLRRALTACLFATCGALLGGSIVWLAGHQDPAPLRAVYAALPAIDAGMIDTVRQQLQSEGLTALFLGPLKGTPYKLYALEGGNLRLSFLAFLLISVPARLVRFVLVALVTAGISRLLSSRLKPAGRRSALIAAWVVFYGWYFHVMS